MNEGEYQAIVEKIVPGGRHGPYAVARQDQLGLITFSLDKPVWKEEWPEAGTVVILSHLRKKRAGWRAASGRFYLPSDAEQQ